MSSWSYIYTFLQSNLLEWPIFFAYYYLRKSPWYKPLLVTTFANSITHPLVFFGFMGLGLPYMAAILTAEAFAMVAETLIHRYSGGLSWKDALNASVMANLLSWQLAPLLTFLVFFRPAF